MQHCILDTSAKQYMYKKTTSGSHRLANAALQNMEKIQPNLFHTQGQIKIKILVIC